MKIYKSEIMVKFKRRRDNKDLSYKKRKELLIINSLMRDQYQTIAY